MHRENAVRFFFFFLFSIKKLEMQIRRWTEECCVSEYKLHWPTTSRLGECSLRNPYPVKMYWSSTVWLIRVLSESEHTDNNRPSEVGLKASLQRTWRWLMFQARDSIPTMNNKRPKLARVSDCANIIHAEAWRIKDHNSIINACFQPPRLQQGNLFRQCNIIANYVWTDIKWKMTSITFQSSHLRKWRLCVCVSSVR